MISTSKIFFTTIKTCVQYLNYPTLLFDVKNALKRILTDNVNLNLSTFKVDTCFGMGAEEFLLRILHTRSFKCKVVTTHELFYPSLQCPWVWLVSTVASTMQARLHYDVQISIATLLPPTLSTLQLSTQRKVQLWFKHL